MVFFKKYLYGSTFLRFNLECVTDIIVFFYSFFLNLLIFLIFCIYNKSEFHYYLKNYYKII